MLSRYCYFQTHSMVNSWKRSSSSIPMAMILIAKTKAYRRANLVHPVQKYILIAVFFMHSGVFNNTGCEKVESRRQLECRLKSSQELIHLNNARNKLFIPVIWCSRSLKNNTRKSSAHAACVFTYYISTEGEVFTGKSPTENFPYWPSDVNIARPRFEDWIFGINK